MDPNSFQPQGKGIPQGAMQVAIRPGGGPNLGAHFAVGVQPGQGVHQAPGHAVPQMQAQISAPSMPKGAQPVPLVQHQLAGAAPQAPAAPPGPPIPQRQAFAPMAHALGQQNQLRPAPALQQQPQQGDRMVVPVEIVGEGPDGRTYTAGYEAEFPAGTKILGVRY